MKNRNKIDFPIDTRIITLGSTTLCNTDFKGREIRSKMNPEVNEHLCNASKHDEPMQIFVRLDNITYDCHTIMKEGVSFQDRCGISSGEYIGGRIRTVTVDVSENESIASIKERVQKKIGDQEAVYHYALYFGGKLLNDGRLLSDYNIQKNSTIIMTVKPKNLVQVIVKCISGKVHHIIVDIDSCNVSKLKYNIARLEGFTDCDPHLWRLYFCGRLLEDEGKPLRHCDITHHSTLYFF